MWRFSRIIPLQSNLYWWISIHQMWRFSRSAPRQTARGLSISIHQMWRFSAVIKPLKNRRSSFQYIKCDGSADSAVVLLMIDFLFQYIKCDGSALDNGQGLCWDCQFQYIKCDGSASGCRHPDCPVRRISIHQMWRFSCVLHTAFWVMNLISIHQMWRFSGKWDAQPGFCIEISIHQMWRFSLFVRLSSPRRNISIHQMWRFSYIVRVVFLIDFIFQYIKCDGSASQALWWSALHVTFQYIKCDGSA